MKRLLITGFDPFGGEKINPAWEAVRRLPNTIGEWDLTKWQIPTVFGLGADCVLNVAQDVKPDAILCIGLAAGRLGVTMEVVGLNLREARIPDNRGNQPKNQAVVAGGPDAYFTTVPVREMVKAVQEEGIPSSLSYTAGAFVCNDVLYSVLHHYNGTNTRVGFIHVPCLPEQAKEGRHPLELEQIVRALTAAISVL